MQADIQELTALVLDAMPQALLLADGGGRVLFRNASARELLPDGGRLQEVLVPSEDPAAFDWKAEVESLEAGGQLVRRNVSLTRRGGRRLLVDIYLRSLRRDVDCACVLVVIEDVSPRVSMERRVVASERLAAVGDFVARIAHDLNNPLDGVLRYIGLAQRRSDAEAARFLDNARAGLMRMADIIRDLREQGTRGRWLGESSQVDKVLAEAVSVNQPRADALGVTVVCDIQAREGALAGRQVFQVFCNIIKNALDAMPSGGVLTMRLRHEQGQCEIEFSDTGCGLTEQEARRVFEPFYTTKPPGEGVGLGLTICRELLAKVNGTITAAPRPGGGAVVTIGLPTERQTNNVPRQDRQV